MSYDTYLSLSDNQWREESARYPDHYMGYWPGLAEEGGYLRVGIGQTRDSDVLDQSNYIAAFNLLTEAAAELPAELEPDGGWVLEHRASHWGPGWVETLWVADVKGLREAVRDMWAALANYPVLDEEDYCAREHEEFVSDCDDWIRWDMRKALEDAEREDDAEVLAELDAALIARAVSDHYGGVSRHEDMPYQWDRLEVANVVLGAARTEAG